MKAHSRTLGVVSWRMKWAVLGIDNVFIFSLLENLCFFAVSSAISAGECRVKFHYKENTKEEFLVDKSLHSLEFLFTAPKRDQKSLWTKLGCAISFYRILSIFAREYVSVLKIKFMDCLRWENFTQSLKREIRSFDLFLRTYIALNCHKQVGLFTFKRTLLPLTAPRWTILDFLSWSPIKM